MGRIIPSQRDQYSFDSTDKNLDIYSNYDKVLLTPDFNAEAVETVFEIFLYHHDLKNHVQGGTCFKIPEQPSCTDLFLTNSPLSLKIQHQYSQVFLTFTK